MLQRDRIAVCFALVPVLIALAISGSGGAARAQEAAPDSVRTPAREPAGAAEQEQLKQTLTAIGRREVPGDREWERRKIPRVAMLSSAILPGLGQVYNGRRIKVAVMVGFMSFYTGNIILNWRQHKLHEAQRDLHEEGTSAWEHEDGLSEFFEERAIDFVWWAGGTWLIGVLDAWIDAHLYDIRAYSPESQEPVEGAAGARLGIGADGDGARYVTLTIGF